MGSWLRTPSETCRTSRQYGPERLKGGPQSGYIRPRGMSLSDSRCTFFSSWSSRNIKKIARDSPDWNFYHSLTPLGAMEPLKPLGSIVLVVYKGFKGALNRVPWFRESLEQLPPDSFEIPGWTTFAINVNEGIFSCFL